MKGKVIVIEGLDGSGKATQTQILFDRLLAERIKVRKVSFPDYQSPSSALVKMYLSGEFGTNPEDVNAYAAAVFYAVDRYASFKRIGEMIMRTAPLSSVTAMSPQTLSTRWPRCKRR